MVLYEVIIAQLANLGINHLQIGWYEKSNQFSKFLVSIFIKSYTMNQYFKGESVPFIMHSFRSPLKLRPIGSYAGTINFKNIFNKAIKKINPRILEDEKHLMRNQ